MKTLLLLLTILANVTAYSQDNSNMLVDRETYRKNLSERDSLRAEVKSLRQLKVDTAMKSRTIMFLNQALTAAKKQSQDNRVDMDTLFSIKKQQADIIADQAKLLGKQD